MSVLLLQYGSVSCLTQQRVSLCPFCLELLSCSITSPTRLNAHSTPPALQLACWPITSSVSSLATQTKACANEGGSLKNMQSFAEQMPSHDSLYENSCGQLLLLRCFSSSVCRKPISITRCIEETWTAVATQLAFEAGSTPHPPLGRAGGVQSTLP